MFLHLCYKHNKQRANSQFTPTTQLNPTQLSWLWATMHYDVISIVTSRCCAQNTRCLLVWLQDDRDSTTEMGNRSISSNYTSIN